MRMDHGKIIRAVSVSCSIAVSTKGMRKLGG